jgi:tetratricopeptide (TPR) repeat protein
MRIHSQLASTNRRTTRREPERQIPCQNPLFFADFPFPAKLKRCAGGGPGNLLPALKDGIFVDNATKRQLKKQDQFVAITTSSAHWADEHRQKAIIAGVIVVVLILAIVGGFSFYQSRSNAAATDFGAAMDTYQTPLVNPAQPMPPGMKTFPDAKSRAAAANAQFQQVADHYGFTSSGKLAEYFVGTTYLDEGQTGPAEQALNKVSTSWDGDVAALAKSALAALYQQSGQDAKAIDLYNQLIKGHAATVPPSLAQLQLAELYQAEGKTEQARQIYADLKDKNKDAKGKPGAAAEIATQKLNPKAAAAAPPEAQ